MDMDMIMLDDEEDVGAVPGNESSGARRLALIKHHRKGVQTSYV